MKYIKKDHVTDFDISLEKQKFMWAFRDLFNYMTQTKEEKFEGFTRQDLLLGTIMAMIPHITDEDIPWGEVETWNHLLPE